MRRIVAGLCLIGVAGIARGQAADSIVGQDVRFRMTAWRSRGPDFGWLEGRVVGVAPDTARVTICAGCREPVQELALADFDIQRHTGFGGSRATNSRWGAVAGAVAGIVVGGYEASLCRPPNDMCGIIRGRFRDIRVQGLGAFITQRPVQGEE